MCHMNMLKGDRYDDTKLVLSQNTFTNDTYYVSESNNNDYVIYSDWFYICFGTGAE